VATMKFPKVVNKFYKVYKGLCVVFRTGIAKWDCLFRHVRPSVRKRHPASHWTDLREFG